jgi:DNA-binding NtrC family response regulator
MSHRFISDPLEEDDAQVLVTPQMASRRVLIVEDEKRLREMLQASITEMGLSPTTAASGEAAINLMNQQSFALAVVDLNLPGIGGIELCERLRRQNPDLQLIILTGFGDLDSARRAIRLQVVDFLTKPCGMDDLENALNRARLRWLDRWPSDTPSEPAPPTLALASKAIEPQSERSIDGMERDLILAALARHEGNRQAAAAEIGISVRKLYYRLQQYQKQGLIAEQ